MKKIIQTSIVVLTTITLSVLGFIFGGFYLTNKQTNILLVLLIICSTSILYCFIVGEISKNNSQMDKLWSILPIAYTWVIAIMGGLNFRLVLYASIVTLWGIRLTFNFARKGAYKLKFWEGEEDYRWAILRKKSIFKSRIAWALFDLLFICIYQNLLVLAMTLPMIMLIDSNASFNLFDILAIASSLFFILIETIADEEQWKFYMKRNEMLKDGKILSEIESPYNLGFNTLGLWKYMRHPNYLSEQAIWVCLYIFTIATNSCKYGIFNWTLFGPMLIILLFLGSSTFGEAISISKYPKYKDYQKQVFKYIPIKKFKY